MKKLKQKRDKEYIDSICGESDSVLYQKKEFYYSTYNHRVKNLRGNY